MKQQERSAGTRILVVSDEVVSTLFSRDVRKYVGPIDVLLSCGDLPYSYLEYLVTRLHTRHAYYVHGNHDSPEYRHDNTTLTAPGGWVNLDRRSVFVRKENLLVAGLEGSLRYKPDAPYQYTQGQMRRRALHLMVKLTFNYVLHGRFLDILITHSPPAGIHDGPDWPHRGFEIFPALMKRFRPRLLLHGHKHRYGPMPWRTRFEETVVVNVHPFRLITLCEDEIKYGRLYRR
ncbi:MAG: metallophosphoesterase family protein [Anaerolineae bacterium]